MPVNERIQPTSGTPINPGGIRQLTIGEIARKDALRLQHPLSPGVGAQGKLSPLISSL
jgi:hypothetical protein